MLEKPSYEEALRQKAERTGHSKPTIPARNASIYIAYHARYQSTRQNMVGEAVHALAMLEGTERVVQAFKQVLPEEKILAGD